MNNFKKQLIKCKLYLKSESRKTIDPREVKAKLLIIKLISDSKSDLKIYPDSNNRVIINDNIKVFIDGNSLSFFNKQSYLVKLCEKNHKFIIDLFDKKLKEEFLKLEEEKDSNLCEYFNTLLNEIHK